MCHFCRNQRNFALLQIIVLFVFLFCSFCSVLNKHLWFFHFCFVFVLLQDLGFVWSFVFRPDSRLLQDELRPLHLQTLGQPTAEHHQGADQDLVHCPAWDDRTVRYHLSILWQLWPRGNGIMDRALACWAGGPGLIPAVGKSSVQYSNGLLSA